MFEKRIYLDWNATSPLLPEARSVFIEALNEFGNASSIYQEGRKSRQYLECARHALAEFCDTKVENVIFTSSATEAANFVLTPDFYILGQLTRLDSLYISAIEHPAILKGGRFPVNHVYTLPVTSEGVIDLEALSRNLESRNFLSYAPMIAVMLVNNETGIIQPVREVSKIVKKHGGILVVDAVQAAGRIPLSFKEIDADFFIISSHKLGGPIGAGALVSRDNMRLPKPLLHGGSQENGYRAGTENIPAIRGFSAAVMTMGKGIRERSLYLSELREQLEKGLKAIVPDVLIYGENVTRISNTCFFTFPHVKAETLQIAFDVEGISVSAGSACSSGKVGTSHVLKAMGYDTVKGALRVSLGPTTSERHIHVFLTVLEKIVKRLP
ncbi:cysteine desulfurase family protein [Liberibacter crescens]|uniref:cysteine desulfurase family protein n=1 Tax=Liberibacter crescens TaxID=1273132 RepID=UPI000762FCAE|nr:cysteine desulfurase family protein [Liberibacter crescens]AMC12911.1 cysteine desulfurase [Liberibacter crescens]